MGGGQKTEFEVKKEISTYLNKINVFHWSDFQPLTKPRKGWSRGKSGVADILGIYQKSPLAIEVKKIGNNVSQTQFQWLKRFEDEGGIAIVAYSVADVMEVLK